MSVKVGVEGMHDVDFLHSESYEQIGGQVSHPYLIHEWNVMEWWKSDVQQSISRSCRMDSNPSSWPSGIL